MTEALLNSSDYRGVFVDTKKRPLLGGRAAFSLYLFAKIMTPMGATGISPKSYSLSVSRSTYLPSI